RHRERDERRTETPARGSAHTAPALQADRRSRFVRSAPRLVSIAFRTRQFSRKRLPLGSRFRQRWSPKARASGLCPGGCIVLGDLFSPLAKYTLICEKPSSVPAPGPGSRDDGISHLLRPAPPPAALPAAPPPSGPVIRTQPRAAPRQGGP